MLTLLASCIYRHFGTGTHDGGRRAGGYRLKAHCAYVCYMDWFRNFLRETALVGRIMQTTIGLPVIFDWVILRSSRASRDVVDC